MPKTLVPRNALRPVGNNTLAQQYVPFRYADPMMNMVPQIPTGPVVDRVPKTTPLQMLDDVLTGYSVGAGKARVGDIQMVEDLLTRPKGVYEDLVAAARALAANPGAVVNALKTGAQHAVSSPTAFGEAVGSFGLPKFPKKLGNLAAIANPYDFKKEAERVDRLVYGNVADAGEYEPVEFNKTYSYPAQTYGPNNKNVDSFDLERNFENGAKIVVNVGDSDGFYGDIPEKLINNKNPPKMYSSSVSVEGNDVAPTGRGALTQMTLEALAIAKKNNGGWLSENAMSQETINKYNRLIAAGVPFKKKGNTYFIMPQDLAKVDLSQIADSLASKYNKP